MDIQHTLAEDLMDQYGCTMDDAFKLAVMVLYVDHDISTEGASWLKYALWANDCAINYALSREFVRRVNGLAMEWKDKLTRKDRRAVNKALECMGY